MAENSQQTFDLALQFHRAGKLAEAQALYQKVVAREPDRAEAWHFLGVIESQSGRFDAAAELIRRAIALQPDYAQAHINLGIALAGMNLLDEAIAAYGRGIVLNPLSAGAHNNLGDALSKTGLIDDAIREYRQAISLDANLAEAHNNLGNALMEKDLPEDAIGAYRRAIEIKGNYAEAWYNLGNALTRQGDLDKAIPALARAIAVNQGYAKAHHNLANVLVAKGRLDEAAAEYRQAIALAPANGESWCNLGIAQEQLGDLAEAQRCYRTAIEKDHDNRFAHAKLATLLGGKLPDADLAALKALLVRASGDVVGRSYVHFALAQVLDGREYYAEAAEHLRAGHALCAGEAKRKGERYDAGAHGEFVRLMIDACSADFFRHVKGMGAQSERPVFIVGLPRSGTTLTEQILSGHPQVFGAGELGLGQEDFLSLAGESTGNPRRDVIEGFALANLTRLDEATIQRLAQKHLRQLEKINAAAARIVDKMPENYLYLGLLAAMFPQAKFIHCRRDLRDVALSCWMNRLDNMPWWHDPADMTSRFEQYLRLMAHWRTVLPGRWMDCDYEQTVADVPATARRLLSWCGLDWDDRCVAFHRVKRPVRTASLAQVRQPIYNRSVGRWKNYQALLAPVLDRLSRQEQKRCTTT